MGCGCGGGQNPPTVTAETPNPNKQIHELGEAWWQAKPAPPAGATGEPATPMPS